MVSEGRHRRCFFATVKRMNVIRSGTLPHGEASDDLTKKSDKTTSLRKSAAELFLKKKEYIALSA
jgi:hypothetical protein